MNRVSENAVKFPEYIGTQALQWIKTLGKVGILFFEALILIFTPPLRINIYFKQLLFIGNKSVFVVILTGMFTGMVLTIQSYHALKTFGSESIIGGIVALSMTRELGPVLTALLVNARAGSAMSAELGTMKVTEQIMALDSMAVNSIQYLISPRIFSGFVMLPFLTVISNTVGIFGGYLVGVVLLGVDPGIFMAKIEDFVDLQDIFGGLFKAAIFGLILSFVGCYKGYTTSGGAEGVGRATTEAVVTSSVLILVSDYIMTSFILS